MAADVVMQATCKTPALSLDCVHSMFLSDVV